MDEVNVIVLAAGQGTRMKSDRPKVLHEIGNAPLVVHAIASAEPLSPARLVVVTGHGAAEVGRAVAAHAPDAILVEQRERKGTGHAVMQTRAALEGARGDAIVLYGDTPFIRTDTLREMRAARERHAVVVLGFEAAEPGRYGRLVTTGETLDRIVEFKDATDEERAITLCNSGVICADAGLLFDLLDDVTDDNAAGELYLTDIVGLARAAGRSCGYVTCDEAETLGINSRPELAAAEDAFQARARQAAMEAGATLIAPGTVFLSRDTALGRDCVVEPNVVFGPGVTVAPGARIRAFSHLEGASVGPGATIGPFARLRPGARLEENVHVGNFVEIKKAEIGAGAKVNHLTYIGDAAIGARTNVGAGTITCNYDGVFKHRTEIGADVFVGSNTMLVAPVRIGDGAMTATGTVVTQDVPEGAMAVGRARAEIKPGFARRFFDKLRAARAAGGKG
ncbi:bifunctional UDP-N-acetylglucosamine diphosphorylase/glucosamine-1-phosphate N-acetyltransferase GlmU [Wenxinia saemankumensis]|uniref:Bifunctional protein GlmU n=1 Tax=Wenxinia saemankumensis TaxID=1447782 RepID=A0A1M6AZK9_9RHOB|nr:bifunctional UDP-N-acetylglucosamine diphosphorylase/glucosamine-1-phosphate N-acetyltransferase GlmU [Wenxinia saemankumensis]SHI41896.1 UDP-N-acetylglucosamine pyrophosphorylase /glucosamine-1-phosphate N-acetyltransferase [Wenxinia saemankumensis]